MAALESSNERRKKKKKPTMHAAPVVVSNVRFQYTVEVEKLDSVARIAHGIAKIGETMCEEVRDFVELRDWRDHVFQIQMTSTMFPHQWVFHVYPGEELSQTEARSFLQPLVDALERGIDPLDSPDTLDILVLALRPTGNLCLRGLL